MEAKILGNLTPEQQEVIVRNLVLDLSKDLSKVNNTLYVGVGAELPLTERVRNMEAYINGLKFWIRTVAIALVGQTVTFGLAALIYFVKLYPLLLHVSQNIDSIK